MACLPEHILLKPVNPKVHSDEWPIFFLENAEIVTQDNPHTPGNLLHADLHHEYTLRGTLEALDDSQQKLQLMSLDPSDLSRIEVSGIRQFAYGQYDDGNIDLWAGGKAGWYTISPSGAHRAMYEHMIEGIRLLYWIADLPDATSKKKKRTLVMDNILQQWAAHAGLENVAHAEKQFLKHSRFLLSSMLAGKEGIDHETNIVFKFLAEKKAKELQFLIEQRNRPIEEKKSRPSLAEKLSLDAEAVSKKRKRASLAPEDIPPHISTLSNRSVTSDEPRSKRPGLSTRSSMSQDDVLLSIPPPGTDHAHALKGRSSLRPKPIKGLHTDSEQVDELATHKRRATTMTPDADQDQPYKRRRQSHRQSVDAQPFAARQVPIVSPATLMDIDEGIDMSLDRDPSDSFVTIDSLQIKHPKILPSEDDIYTCPLSGCMHHVYEASTEAAQRLIKDHYRSHVRDEEADPRIKLIRLQGRGLPTSRLMQRINPAKEPRPGFAERIVQRY